MISHLLMIKMMPKMNNKFKAISNYSKKKINLKDSYKCNKNKMNKQKIKKKRT